MAIGLFGKLPSQGDFVSRRLPWEFTSAWDDWLQAGISHARSLIGADWNETYLTAPLWRFQLQPGVIGASGWIGLWFPSVDRVGRQFPLALFEPLPPGWDGRYAVIEQDESFFSVEDVALRGLDPRLNFDSFDRSLDGLSLLSPVESAVNAVAQVIEIPDPLRQPDNARNIRFPTDADMSHALRLAQSAGPAGSCFFSWGNEQHAPSLCRCDGLLGAAEFHSFIDGRWP
ncbi:MAG: type VI secretion system-associated protein TagF [Ideonella sp.]